MKIGQVEFTWRAHRQACVVKIGGEQRVFRFNKKTTRKELFAKIRSLIAEAAGTQKVCQHCCKHYFGVNSHNFLCGDCAQKAAEIYDDVNNNVAGAVKVIGDASYSTRYAFFPCCYDEDRNAWKGVECYKDGTVGNMWLWFTKCYLLEATGKKFFIGYRPRYTEWLRTDETVLIPLWHNSDGYSQHKGADAKRVYGVIANTGEDNDIFVNIENGEFKFNCKGFVSDDVCTDSHGNACVRVPERQLKPAVVFGNKTVKYERLLTWDEDEL